MAEVEPGLSSCRVQPRRGIQRPWRDAPGRADAAAAGRNPHGRGMVHRRAPACRGIARKAAEELAGGNAQGIETVGTDPNMFF